MIELRFRHSCERHNAHQGAKASWSLKTQGALEARVFLCKAHPILHINK